MHYVMATAIVVIAFLGNVINANMALIALVIVAVALMIDIVGGNRERQRRERETKRMLNARYGRRMQAHQIDEQAVIAKLSDIADRGGE